MDPLRIYTLGGLRVLRGDEPVIDLEARKAEALLVYLAYNRREHPREVLADLLWDERSQRQSLSNLRVVLASLRKRLGPYLDITRGTIALNPKALVWIDVTEFEATLQVTRTGVSKGTRVTGAAGEADTAKLGLSETDVKAIERSVELYQGEFLRGFFLRESRGFEAWLVQERERLHRLATSALHELVRYALRSGAYQAGMAHATHLLALDTFNELAHQQMMQLLAFSGNRSKALAQYETCRRLLWEEFGVEPAAETKTLVEKIRYGELEIPASAGALPSREIELQGDNPYKGLRAFQEADAADFFGREALTRRLVAHLGEAGEASRFLAVVGPSGSGKSSLVKAGLIPALRGGALPGSEKWVVVEMIPGRHPLDELEIGLLQIAADKSSSLNETLRRDERGIVRAARLALPAYDSELLLVIDQFEEVFTLVENKAEGRQFLEGLYTAVTEPHSLVRVVITLRADFFDRPLLNPDLSRLLQDRIEVVIPLAVDEMERAIRAPAERLGIAVETRLVAAIVADMVKQPGALPLLQYALTELFELRSKNRLTLEEYQSIGGVQGVLERRAEETFAGLSASGKVAARQAFLRLVTLGEGVEDARRRVLLSELEAVTLLPLPPNSDILPLAGERVTAPPLMYAEAITEVMDAFGKARLLSFDRDPLTRSPTVEIAHEALLREWSRLRSWLDEGRADMRLQRALGNAAAEWRRAGLDPSFLLHGARLSQFESWAAEANLGLTGDERAYLEASLAERETQRITEENRKQREAFIEQRARNFLHALVVVLLLATAGSLALAGLARRAQTLANSRELAVHAINNIDKDPELSILLSLHALRTEYTREAEEALHQAIQSSRVRMTLTGYTGGARSVEFSLEGEAIVIAGDQQNITVWEVSTGKNLFSLEGRIARFSPNGSYLAVGSDDGLVTLWEFATRKKLVAMGGHKGGILDLHFSPDGTLLVSSGADNVFIVWDVMTGEKKFTSPDFSDSSQLSNAMFSSDGKMLVSIDQAGSGNRIRFWGVDDWSLRNEVGGVNELVTFSPDGRWMVTTDDGEPLATGITLWDLSQASLDSPDLLALEPLVQKAAHTSIINDFAFSRNSSMLATGSIDSTAKLWRLSNQGVELLMTLYGHTASVITVAFSSDGSQLATASEDGTVRIWDISPGHHSEGSVLAGHTMPVFRLASTLDGKYLATSSADGTARIWELYSGKELLVVTGHVGPLFGSDINRDGTLLVTAGDDNKAKIWGLNLSSVPATAELLKTLDGHAPGPKIGNLFPGLTSAVFSPDGTQVATGGVDGMAKVWNVTSGQELLSLQAHPERRGITRLAFSPDGRLLVTATDGPLPLVKVWEVAGGTEVTTFSGHIQANRIWSAVFSPDGKHVATGSYGGGLIIWDAMTGQELQNITGHTSTITGVDFSPDGRLLASVGVNGAAMLWDLSSGETRREFINPSETFFDTLITPDGKYMLILGGGSVYSYIIDLDETMRLAQARLTRWFRPEECREYLHRKECPPR